MLDDRVIFSNLSLRNQIVLAVASTRLHMEATKYEMVTRLCV
jgi:hypothetical protein